MIISPQEAEIITFLRECKDHDEVRILVNEDKEGLVWTILQARNSKKVIHVPKSKG